MELRITGLGFTCGWYDSSKKNAADANNIYNFMLFELFFVTKRVLYIGSIQLHYFCLKNVT